MKHDLSARRSELSKDKQALLERRLRGEAPGAAEGSVIPRRTESGPAALSYAQQRLWFLDQLAPGNPFYNIPAVIPLHAPDLSVLHRALNEIIRRHEALRTTFVAHDGQPRQVVAPALHLPLPVLDLQADPVPERTAARLASEEAQRPFDLARGPLLRAQLLRLAPADFRLLLTLHHIVADGWSLGVLGRELSALYAAFAAGQPSPLPPLPIQYPDFAVWQRRWLQGDLLQRQLQYWTAELADLPVLQLPTDRPRPPLQSFRGAFHPLTIPPPLTAALRRLAQAESATLFMTLLAAFHALLARYSGQDDIVVGSPIANRTRSELEPLIGFFVNSLVLRVSLADDPPFRTLLARVRAKALAAYAHQDLPFEKLVEELHPERDLSRNPLFQVMFQLQNTPGTDAAASESSASLGLEMGGARFDCTLSMLDSGQRLTGRIEYNTDLFDPASIARLGDHYLHLLAAISADPAQRVSKMPLLGSAERQQIVVDWNQTAAPYPADRCVHELFEAQVAERPDAVALRFDAATLTYAELDRRANQLAHYLRRLGVGPDRLVGLCLPRSFDMIVAIMGVLKAGGAYVPLDPAHPQERLTFMVRDTAAPVLLTHVALASRLSGTDAHIVCLDRDWPVIAGEPEDRPVSGVTSAHLAYVIYTSGSTGRPKGVAVPHRGVCNAAEVQRRTFGMGPGSHILQFSSLSFDGSMFELITAFPVGATLCLARVEDLVPGPGLVRLLRDQDISFVMLPPSSLAILPVEPLPELRVLTVSGEVCPAELVAAWAPGRRFLNLYGPTETTIWCTFAECVDGNRRPCIGRPIANTRIYVLDAHLQPVPVGVSGELCIGGVGVARGYLNRPELTAEKFVPDPFGDRPDGRLYRSGDLVRYLLPDGAIDYIGRLDQQVKVRGFRIELGEIETALAQHNGVLTAVVGAREDVPGDKRLVAYVVPRPGVGLSAAELRGVLRGTLPEYMVPTAFVFLPALPLNSSGKVDRQALPRPDTASAEPRRVVEAPRSETERAIAAVWRDALQLPEVGRDDNFFDVGGHSLLLARVQIALEIVLDRGVSLIDMFRYPTVSALARHLSGEPDPAPARSPIQERAERQQQAWSQRRPLRERQR